MSTDWKTMDEMSLRNAEAPSPSTSEDLVTFVKEMVDRNHDHGTCVYAMSLSSVATFNYVAGKLGASGFQASCADIDFIRRTRLIKGPFAIVDINETLYPQYDVRAELEKLIHDSRDWQREEARRLLDKDNEFTSKRVIEHWKKLASE